MKVFIRQSGDVSPKCTAAFRDSLAFVRQRVVLYIYSEDIGKGARQGTDIVTYFGSQ
jgi:hypothetical protein